LGPTRGTLEAGIDGLTFKGEHAEDALVDATEWFLADISL
jgi:hypothetical protein